MGMIFKQPPKPRRGRPPLIDWDAVARQLKERPGEWGLVLRNANRAHAWRVNSGTNLSFEEGQFEATIVNGDHAKGDLYIRYVGEGK